MLLYLGRINALQRLYFSIKYTDTGTHRKLHKTLGINECIWSSLVGLHSIVPIEP